MWVTMIVVSMALVQLVIKMFVWALGVMIMTPVKGFGLLTVAVFAGIGICQLIDKIREK
tara:strand:+ start:135 stop:311 length:177 start_codon:yes stop_codon:yes gene_type:complete